MFLIKQNNYCSTEAYEFSCSQTSKLEDMTI